VAIGAGNCKTARCGVADQSDRGLCAGGPAGRVV
jgi:hypothetical protein